MSASACLISRSFTAALVMVCLFLTHPTCQMTITTVLTENNRRCRSAPALSDWQATYSYDTRFIPSRRLVTRATSVTAYSAHSSWNASCLLHQQQRLHPASADCECVNRVKATCRSARLKGCEELG